MKLEEIQQKARCNWCRNILDTSEKITENNFVDTGKKYQNGDPAYALYCNECLAWENRRSDPKAVIDRETLYEINVDALVSPKETETTTEREKKTTKVKKSI
jgi:hypothetical protein